MPEGDSIHKLADRLGPLLTGERLTRFELPRQVNDGGALVGQEVTGVEARGKNLLVHFASGTTLHVHLKMWGRVLVTARSSERAAGLGPDVVALLETQRDRVLVIKAPVARLLRTADLRRDFHFRGLGPDLLAPTFPISEALSRLKAQREVPLGEALLDQRVVAGIGNVWKSELCFNLKLDPFAKVAVFAEDELRGLLELGQQQMRANVERKPRTLPDPFAPRPFARVTRENARQGQKRVSVYGRAGEACYDCGTEIRMQHQGSLARSTYYCPTCQPARSAA